VFLDPEQRKQDAERDRQHPGLKRRRGDLQPFDRRQHGDGWCDRSVAKEQGSTDQAKQRDGLSAAVADPLYQGHEGHDATLAVVVRAQDEGCVLDSDDQDQRPEDERQDSENVLRCNRNGVMGGRKHLAHRVQRAGAYVPVDDAERRQSQDAEG
jgi:hypothetical protein